MIVPFAKYQMIKDRLYLIDMFASWCGPCKTQAAILDELQKDEDRVEILKIDVEADLELTSYLNILGVPTLLLVKNKMVLWKKPGVLDKEEIKKIIDEVY